jgi:site-specific DNA-adenine methylase
MLRKYNVRIAACDYKDMMPWQKDAFVYFDPPYYHTKGMYYGKIDYSEL